MVNIRLPAPQTIHIYCGKRHVFYAAASKQPVAKLANRHLVEQHIVAAQSAREWLFSVKNR